MNCTPIDLPTKLRMAFLRGQRISQRDIAELTRTSKSSVNRVLQLLDKKETHEVKYDFLTQLRYHFVLYKIIENCFITYHDIAKSISKFDFKISESTVLRIAHNLNIKDKLQKPKEKLSQLQKNNRIIFCQNYLKSEYIQLPMVFSDESMISLEPFRKKIKILPVFDNEEYFFEKSGYPLKIMIWGCVALNLNKLILIKKKLNSKKYIQLLTDNKIFESLNERFGSYGYIFQQDGASSHTAKITIEFLSQKVNFLSPHGNLKWPSNSPDLNVIEILWAIIKAKLNTDNIKNQEELFNEINKIWEEIPIETINLLIRSFNSRLHSCIMLNGESLNEKKKNDAKI